MEQSIRVNKAKLNNVFGMGLALAPNERHFHWLLRQITGRGQAADSGYGIAKILTVFSVDAVCFSSYTYRVNEIVIEATFDDEARVWVAVNDELGLATEADTAEVLTYKLQQMVPELVTLNKLEVPRPIAFRILFQRRAVAFA